jgi:predicted component of type VI protein secretion system
MNNVEETLIKLITKYEKRIKNSEAVLAENPNDTVEGLKLSYESALAEFKGLKNLLEARLVEK